MTDQKENLPGEFVSEVTDRDELNQLLKLNCVFYGGVNNTNKTLTLVNRCNKCMAATIFWTPWHGNSFTKTYKVPGLTAKHIRIEAESSSLIAEYPC